MRAVLKIASEPAILEAMLISLAMKIAMVKVLQMANSRQTNAFINDLPAPSAPDFRPACDLFMRRSPMNIVKDLEAKSDPTIERAVAMDPENLKDVINVTLPAITRHMRALTADLAVVSEKLAAGVEFSVLPLRYSCFLDFN